MTDWDESTKFKAETLRSVLLAIAGAIAATALLRPWEQDLEYRAELEKAKLAIKSKVVEDLSAAGRRYTAVAYDACLAYPVPQEARSADDAATIIAFEANVVDDYGAVLERLSVYFSESQSIVKGIEEASALRDDLFAKCKRLRLSKPEWEPTRRALEVANHRLSLLALHELGFVVAATEGNEV